MDLSFVVPLTSQLALVEKSVFSLEKITAGTAFEILLVGNSSDCRSTKENPLFGGDRIKTIDAGQRVNRAHLLNRGADHSRGQTLVFVSPGTRFEPNSLQPLLEGLKSTKDIGLLGSSILENKNERPSPSSFHVTANSLFSAPPTSGGSNRFFPRPYSKFDLISSPSVAIPRKLFREFGDFDEAYTNSCEVYDLCLRLRSVGKHCYIANKSLVSTSAETTDTSSQIEKARDDRYLQRRWKSTLLELAAENWPATYLKELLARKQPLKSKLALEALARWTRFINSQSPTALQIANGRMCSNEIRWAREVEKRMPSEIRKEQCKQYGNWLTERISYTGIFQSQGDRHGVWVKEEATLSLPRGLSAESLTFDGNIHPTDSDHTKGQLGLRITINETEPKAFYPLPEGPFSLVIESPSITPEKPSRIKLQLLGAGRANAYAYLGRKVEDVSIVPKHWRQNLSKYRPQKLNQRLCLHRVSLDDEPLLDFKARPSSPQCFEFVRNNSDLGINLVAWHTAELGVGESGRVAAKALQASKIEHALVPLKATCLASKGDTSVSHLLQDDNPYPINVFHIDAPQSKDIDPSHGKAFRNGKYNIAYWAWELPEFPDAWIENFRYFDEIWTPSNFVRNAIAAKSPIPVVTIPHCIDFPIPEGNFREQLKLPSDKYLFCFAYDLNSYQSRKNPQAVIEAYRLAFLAGDRRDDVGLVIKTQSRARNPEAYAKLQAAIEGVPNCYLIDETLPRETVYGLMKACDSYVSLHRSEGFGLTVAESMYLGKPVLSTNWSATSEFLDQTNGCPVDYRLIELEETHGPYSKGQIWADPSAENAADYMLKLVNDSDYAAEIGKNAARTIRERFSPKQVASIYENRLKAMCAW